ncbi:hypothetical protein [Lactococcus lactis]|uniref:hypothetical protein n=1 Tax=Lactococcus lactis TaxID=1358 RepID=UPI0024179C62|nr:hypothetical protein [Lactococcus lactis]MDG4957322.1 hypothetical protein [Lactococcus lactis]WNN68636.1 hypothetical protein RIN59_00810 [Lactococcus lactis]WPK08628.1 hypothetical protein R6U80_10550 [Lactococcus lactis]
MIRLEKVQKYVLLQLTKNINTINDVRNKILANNYEKPFRRHLPDDMPSSEANLEYKWQYVSVKEEKNTFVQLKSEIISIKSIANLEYSKRIKAQDVFGNYLPKEERTGSENVEVQFISFKNRWYCIAFTNDEAPIDRIKKLIGDHYIEDLPSEYQIDSDFLHWIFYRYITERKQLSNNIRLSNINEFSGTIVNDENKFRGISDKTAELIITRAFIANQGSLATTNVTLKMLEGTAEFYLNKVSNKTELKIRVGKKSTITPILSSDKLEYTLPIYIYFYLIPIMMEFYKDDQKDFHEKDHDFRQQISLEVIRSIMMKNDITSDKINDLITYDVKEDAIQVEQKST